MQNIELSRKRGTLLNPKVYFYIEEWVKSF